MVPYTSLLLIARAITEGDSYPQHKPWLKRSYYLVLSYYSKLKLFSILNHSDLDLSDPKSQALSWACYISCSMIISYSKEKLLNRNHFSIFSHSDLDLDPSVIHSKVLSWGCYISSYMIISHSKLKLLIGNYFSIFLPKWPWPWPKCPESNPNQGLVMRMLYIKFHYHIVFQTEVIERKPFYYF